MEETGSIVIDGSMSTELEQLGCYLNDSLWTAREIAECPKLVRQVHVNYFRAGADCSITCGYQATIPGLTAVGYSIQEAEQIITRSVEIFQEARREWWETEGHAAGRVWPLCLGAVGPYGSYLADGSEYRGNYGVLEEALRPSISGEEYDPITKTWHGTRDGLSFGEYALRRFRAAAVGGCCRTVDHHIQETVKVREIIRRIQLSNQERRADQS